MRDSCHMGGLRIVLLKVGGLQRVSLSEQRGYQ